MIQSFIIQSASFNEDEIEISNILLNLKGLIEESESRSRKRTSDRNLGFSFNSPSHNVERNSQIREEERDDIKIKPKFVKFKSKKKRYSSKDQARSSKRKTREELMCNIEKLTQCRESLREEGKKVQSYYNHQQAYNLELKAMREKVMTNLYGQEPESSHMSQYPMGHFPQIQPMSSSTIGLSFVSGSGPVVGIPNLDIIATNSKCPFENNSDIAERKAKYTEARRKRRMKMIENKRSSGQKHS